jgi:hypothetical protein
MYIGNRDISFDIATRLRYGRPNNRGSNPGQARSLSFLQNIQTSLAYTHLPIQWIPGDLSTRVKQPGRKADHFVVSTLRMSGDVTPVPQTLSWCTQDSLSLLFSLTSRGL